MIIALRANRTPTLAVAARVAAADRAADRAAERQQASPARRWARRAMVFVALVFASLAVLGGAGAKPAQAWPWDDVKNLPGIIINFCGPADVPELATYAGFDNGFGLNTPDDREEAQQYAEHRGTILAGDIPMDGSGYERLQKTFPGGGDYADVIHPTYDRYGFSALRWTNFQQGCASVGFWSAGPINWAFDFLVKLPTVLTMAGIRFALDNVLYDIFTTMISPFVKVFAAIFRPWVMVFAVLIGLPLVWMKTRGSVSKMLSAALWIAFVMGTFLWITNNTSTVVTTANNFVSSFTSDAACQLIEVDSPGGGGTCTADGGTAGLNNALWRGVPYDTWMLGEVGDDQATRDRAAEADGRIGWSQAILNGMYVGTKADGTVDDKGKDLLADVDAWNRGTYGKNGDDTKTNLWTKDDQWKKVPFLTVVKFICNDDEPANGSDGNGDDDNNRWSRNSCQAGKAGTASWVGYFRGEHYDHRLVAAFTGGVTALCIFITLELASLYVAYQKMLFYWILLWAPLWLAIGAIPQKRDFVLTYAERAFAVVIKQCVGLLTVLFVATAMSNLLYPPPGSNLPNIPASAKSLYAILFFLTMIALFYPARKIAKAVVKNDTEIVNKSLDAPSDAAKWTIKTTVKAGVVAGMAVATGGTSLGAAALASGKAGAAANLLSGAGKTGKLASIGIRLAEWRKNLGDLKGQADGMKRAEQAGAAALIRQNPAKYGLRPGQAPTKEAMAQATQDHRKTAKAHERASLVDQEYTKAMQAQFQAHRRKHGEFHPLDPANPINKEADPGELRARMLRAMQGRALDVVNSPKWASGEDLKAKVILPSDQIKLGANVTSDKEAAQKLGGPDGILAQYNNNPGLLDPRHQATPALMKLMFAEANPNSESFKLAFREAVSAVGAYGVPNKVEAVWAVGQTAQDFSPAAVLGVMRPLSASDSAQHRLNDAIAFSAASASIPADHPAFEAVNRYREALANPGVSAGDVNALGFNVANAFQTDNPHLITPNRLTGDVLTGLDDAARRFAEQAGTRDGWAPVGGWAARPGPEPDPDSYRQPASARPAPADPTSPPDNRGWSDPSAAQSWRHVREPAPPMPPVGYWAGFNEYEFRRDIVDALGPLMMHNIQPSRDLQRHLEDLAGDPYRLADDVARMVREQLRAHQESPPPHPPTPPPPAPRGSGDGPDPDPSPDPGPYEGDDGDRGSGFFPRFSPPS